eukprot:365327-Chlamydomonas_euryale.AAC.8
MLRRWEATQVTQVPKSHECINPGCAASQAWICKGSQAAPVIGAVCMSMTDGPGNRPAWRAPPVPGFTGQDLLMWREIGVSTRACMPT